MKPHRGQPRPSGQPRRPLRQGRRRDHAPPLPRPPARAAAPHRPARLGRVQGDHLGRGARHRHQLAGADPREAPREARLLHRPRPVAVLHRLVGAAVRHPQLRRPRRLLLGQHGGGRHLHPRRRLLGVRRPRLGAHEAPPPLRRRRGPRQQPDQDRPRQAQGTRRPHRLDQPGPHRLLRHRRPVARHHPRHRRPPRPQPRSTADAAGKIDLPYLLAYTNAAWLVDQDPRSPGFGTFLRDADGHELVWDPERHKAVPWDSAEAKPAAHGHLQRRPDPRQAGLPAHGRGLPRPRARAGGGRPRLRPRPGDIRRLAALLARTAFEEAITLDRPWTDFRGSATKR